MNMNLFTQIIKEIAQIRLFSIKNFRKPFQIIQMCLIIVRESEIQSKIIIKSKLMGKEAIIILIIQHIHLDMKLTQLLI